MQDEIRKAKIKVYIQKMWAATSLLPPPTVLRESSVSID